MLVQTVILRLLFRLFLNESLHCWLVWLAKQRLAPSASFAKKILLLKRMVVYALWTYSRFRSVDYSTEEVLEVR